MSAGSKGISPVPFKLVSGDVVSSWNFQGAYTGNADLTQKAQAEIARLTGLIGSKQYTDYLLYVSIANQYDLLGDGAKEFEYLNKALAIDSTKTGLAWDNMGGLFWKLGANLSARVAYRNAIIAQPVQPYAKDYYEFLIAKFPNDTAGMTEAQKILVEGAPPLTQ
jgi:tetratricopeptide (TPR) repeat protein